MHADGAAGAIPEERRWPLSRLGTQQLAAGSLLVLAAGQFLMTLDRSVMNVSIRQVTADVGTTVTGIQTAVTLYTLVIASLMITGAKIGWSATADRTSPSPLTQSSRPPAPESCAPPSRLRA